MKTFLLTKGAEKIKIPGKESDCTMKTIKIKDIIIINIIISFCIGGLVAE